MKLRGMRDMEAMVDLLRFGVPQWRHERLQARRGLYFTCFVKQASINILCEGLASSCGRLSRFVSLLVSVAQQKAAIMQGCCAPASKSFSAYPSRATFYACL